MKETKKITLEKLVNKIDFTNIEKISLCYDDCITSFEDVDQLEDEMARCDLYNEIVEKYTISKGILKITIGF